VQTPCHPQAQVRARHERGIAARSIVPYVTVNSSPNPAAAQTNSQCFPVVSAGFTGVGRAAVLFGPDVESC
jgi:hypothetical protein